MSEPKEQTLKVWGNKVETKVLSRGSGPPLIFLHGAMGLTWDPFLEQLSESFTVYAPYLPGTAPGFPDAIKPIDNLWDRVLVYYEIFDKLNLEKPAVVGHSFGGMLGAELAATNPERVAKLVLMNPIGLWLDESPVKNWMTTSQLELGPLIFSDPTGPAAQLMATPPADPEEGIQMALRTTWSLACTGKFIWPIPDKGLKKRLHRISSPTLLPWGEDDGIVPPVYADEFASAIKDTAIQIIPKAGHLPQLEQLDTVVSVTNKFLTS